jgi:hypothetical protein
MGLGSELLHILSFLPQPLANCRFGCLLHLTGYIWRKVKEGYACMILVTTSNELMRKLAI